MEAIVEDTSSEALGPSSLKRGAAPVNLKRQLLSRRLGPVQRGENSSLSE
jgi:hypothetical protein